MNLIDQMKFFIDAMTLGEKVLGSIVVTILGIGIVFVALIILFLTIVAMQKVLGRLEPKRGVELKPIDINEEEKDGKLEDTELVAVITAAIAASLNTFTHNIVVRNITRTQDSAPAWAKAGRRDQITGGY